ncbi:hypothetical protein [Haloplanus natans]|uniref:hypothetical protein n=1 Tax=Haloplanus natans TaxID=376171 RepID=UPI0006781F1D|nr:hypothetical protein [Haloplanus natans]
MSLAVDDEREALLDLVREDPDLAPQEKETTLRFTKDEDAVRIYTEEAGIGRRLLAHPSATVGGVTVLDGGVRPPADIDEVDGRDIVAVRARVPVGAVKILLNTRESTQHAEVVSERVLYPTEEGDRE